MLNRFCSCGFSVYGAPGLDYTQVGLKRQAVELLKFHPNTPRLFARDSLVIRDLTINRPCTLSPKTSSSKLLASWLRKNIPESPKIYLLIPAPFVKPYLKVQNLTEPEPPVTRLKCCILPCLSSSPISFGQVKPWAAEPVRSWVWITEVWGLGALGFRFPISDVRVRGFGFAV